MTDEARQAAQDALAEAAKEFGEAKFADLVEVRSVVEARFKANMTREEMAGVLGVLGSRAKMLPWVIGDALVQAEKLFGEEWVQLAELTGLSIGTLRQYAWVAKNIPPSRRVPGVDFSVHRLLGRFDAKTQSKYLSLSRRDGLGTRQVREQMVADGVLEDRPKKSAVEKFQAVWHAASHKAREEIAGLVDEWRAEVAQKHARKAKAKKAA